jgi:hypothetical protein
MKSNVHKWNRLEFFVTAVAENRMSGVLAAAEMGDFGFCSFEFDRRESGALVAAIAEGLALAQAAGAPEVALAGFDLDSVRTLLRNGRFGHRELS